MKSKIVLVGIGGYGGQYVMALTNWKGDRDWEVVGIVDPMAEKAQRRTEALALCNRVYKTLDEFYAEQQADLAVIASPIQYHCAQTCAALAHGTNVLCEKPICAVIQQAYEMIEARDKSNGKFVAIGYQWSFSPQMQALKADILAGMYGAPKRLKTIALWPRTDTYYGRNNWAGGLKSANGDWILDSPVNNATAHYLHNMLYVTGPAVDCSATPVSVQAELYRANPITNYDTAALRVMTDNGAEILFYTTHAVSRLRGPEFVYEFEKGTVYYDTRKRRMWSVMNDGAVKEYGNPHQGVEFKLGNSIKASLGEGGIVCGPEAAMMHTLCMNGAQESVPSVGEFPWRDVYKAGAPGSQVRVMTGLAEQMEGAYDANLLPGEYQPMPWTQVGRKVSLTDYKSFGL
jgi:predicted dehydrogenase